MKKYRGLSEQLKAKPHAREQQGGRFKSAPARHPYTPEPQATPKINEVEDISGEHSVHKGQYKFKQTPGQIGTKRSESPILPEDTDPCWKGYEMVGMKDKNGKKVPNCVPKNEQDDKFSRYMPEGEFKKEWSKTGKEATHRETGEKTHEYQELGTDGKPTGRREYRNAQGKPMGESKETPPFDPDPKPRKKSVIPGKAGEGYSTARHLARQAMQQQMKKKPMKEEMGCGSRKKQIVREALKDAKMKNKDKETKGGKDKFQADPELTSQIVTTNQQ